MIMTAKVFIIFQHIVWGRGRGEGVGGISDPLPPPQKWSMGRRVVENGVETVTVEEDGVVKSHTRNGENTMITN
ncbi:hypothetical protein MAR_004367 [Mya arenaria]|uniref:Uncharacterized protein n=1 Tax=Mya arenaria TaxID=6604 RepID=A0ABY7EZG3_MYAAR|nr:hypothetical protein MAR_004367 [Mya arenaria]